MAELVTVPDLESGDRRFESCHPECSQDCFVAEFSGMTNNTEGGKCANIKTQPGRSTVKDAVLIRRRRRFDSFSGYAASAAFEPWSVELVIKTECGEFFKRNRNNWKAKVMVTLHRLKQIPTLNLRSWCNGSTSVF